MADDRNGPLDGYTTIATNGSHNRAKAIEIESFHVVQNNLVSLLLQSKREDSTKSVKLVVRNPQHALEESTRKYRPDNTPRYVCEAPVVIAGAYPGRTTFVMPCRA